MEISSKIPGTCRGLSGAGLTSWAATHPGAVQSCNRGLRVTAHQGQNGACKFQQGNYARWKLPLAPWWVFLYSLHFTECGKQRHLCSPSHSSDTAQTRPARVRLPTRHSTACVSASGPAGDAQVSLEPTFCPRLGSAELRAEFTTIMTNVIPALTLTRGTEDLNASPCWCREIHPLAGVVFLLVPRPCI